MAADKPRQSLSLDPVLSHTGVIHRKRFRDGRMANTPLEHHRNQELLWGGRMNSQSVQNKQNFVHFEMIHVCTLMGKIQQ